MTQYNYAVISSGTVQDKGPKTKEDTICISKRMTKEAPQSLCIHRTRPAVCEMNVLYFREISVQCEYLHAVTRALLSKKVHHVLACVVLLSSACACMFSLVSMSRLPPAVIR